MTKLRENSQAESAESRDDQPVVRVRNLQKRFIRAGGDIVQAIDDVSFDVPPGEFTVLLGPSGCGKTTLLRSIAGLETPDAGDIEVHGKQVFSSRTDRNIGPEKRRISMVFQSYALWPHMTVSGNVAYPLRSRKPRPPKKEIDERVGRVLEMVGIPELVDQYPSQMSGGQQQRVALARALVVGTDLVLFDEPLSNVDAKVREQLRLELLEMQSDLGFAALFVTHDQAEAMVLADRIAVLEKGKIVQFGSPREIYAEPNSRYVANFIGTTNEVVGTVRSFGLDRKVLVETALGEVHGVAPDEVNFEEGEQVVAVWRPEVFELSSDEPRLSINSWRGRVSASLFLGSHIEHIVNLQGQELRVWSPHVRDAENEDEVWLTVPREAVRVVPA